MGDKEKLIELIEYTVDKFRKDVFNKTIGFDIISEKTICVRCISILGSYVITIGGLGSYVEVINFDSKTNMRDIVNEFIEYLEKFSEMYSINDIFENTVDFMYDCAI